MVNAQYSFQSPSNTPPGQTGTTPWTAQDNIGKSYHFTSFRLTSVFKGCSSVMWYTKEFYEAYCLKNPHLSTFDIIRELTRFGEEINSWPEISMEQARETQVIKAKGAAHDPIYLMGPINFEDDQSGNEEEAKEQVLESRSQVSAAPEVCNCAPPSPQPQTESSNSSSNSSFELVSSSLLRREITTGATGEYDNSEIIPLIDYDPAEHMSVLLEATTEVSISTTTTTR